jgi:hypothetical protein
MDRELLQQRLFLSSFSVPPFAFLLALTFGPLTLFLVPAR